MVKKIIICADDFGMSDNINSAIINLLEKRLLMPLAVCQICQHSNQELLN